MTRDQYISDLVASIQSAVPTNTNLTGAALNDALNATIGTMYTVDPTKKPTVKRITDIVFV